jgi:hypothetical protein
MKFIGLEPIKLARAALTVGTIATTPMTMMLKFLGVYQKFDPIDYE